MKQNLCINGHLLEGVTKVGTKTICPRCKKEVPVSEIFMKLLEILKV